MAEEKQSWWQTLPGILTATAGIITAVTGFLLAMNQSGCFHKSEKTSSVLQTHVDTPVEGNKVPQQAPPETSIKTDTITESDTATKNQQVTANSSTTNQSDEINLLSEENGGNIVAASDDDWKNTIDGSEDWAQLNYGIGQQAVYGFKDGKSATFHTFTMLIGETAEYNIKDFELLAGNDSPTGKFTSLGKFKTQNVKLYATPYQVFSFDQFTAKYLKFKLISTYDGLHPAIHEFQLWGKLN